MNRTRAILSTNRALLGEVSPPLRAVKIHWSDEKLDLFFYYDGEISEEDRESAECVGTEVIAGFPGYELEENINRLDYPKFIPENEGELVYKRREKASDPFSQKGFGNSFKETKQKAELPDNSTSKIDRVNAILSMNKALIGEISPALRSAQIQSNENEVHLYFYYDGEISEEDQESAKYAAARIISDFPRHSFKLSILRLDYPNPIPQEETTVVYRRREEKPPTPSSKI